MFGMLAMPGSNKNYMGVPCNNHSWPKFKIILIKKWDGNPTIVQVFGRVIKNLDGSGFSHPNFLNSSSFYHPTFLTVVF